MAGANGAIEAVLVGFLAAAAGASDRQDMVVRLRTALEGRGEGWLKPPPPNEAAAVAATAAVAAASPPDAAGAAGSVEADAEAASPPSDIATSGISVPVPRFPAGACNPTRTACRVFATGPDQGLGRDPAERGAGGQPGHGLDQVGLALAIVADDGGPPVAERQVDGCQVPEVGERQPPNRHRTAAPDYDTRTGISR